MTALLLSKSAPAAGMDANAPVAMIGSKVISEADLVAQDQAEFDKQETAYELSLHSLQNKHAQERHDLLQSRLEKLLNEQAVELEAKARGITSAAVLKEITVAPVTDDQILAFYNSNLGMMDGKPLEAMRPQIIGYLANHNNESAQRSFYEALRKKHDIRIALEPYRLPVATTGPALGKAKSPVTIVEFADFQCPYCKRAEDAVKAVIARHPDDVRLVFRNLPIVQLHPDADRAAVAAVCADRQGQFWPMHDAMFKDQKALGDEGLKDTAKRLGLKMDAFEACLTDPGVQSYIRADEKAADDLGITTTPYFFINGRPLVGSQPDDHFEVVVEDELRRNAPKS